MNSLRLRDIVLLKQKIKKSIRILELLLEELNEIEEDISW